MIITPISKSGFEITHKTRLGILTVFPNSSTLVRPHCKVLANFLPDITADKRGSIPISTSRDTKLLLNTLH